MAVRCRRVLLSFRVQASCKRQSARMPPQLMAISGQPSRMKRKEFAIGMIAPPTNTKSNPLPDAPGPGATVRGCVGRCGMYQGFGAGVGLLASVGLVEAIPATGSLWWLARLTLDAAGFLFGCYLVLCVGMTLSALALRGYAALCRSAPRGYL